MKEAYLKAIGTGLTHPLASVVVALDGGHPRIESLREEDPAEWSTGTLDLGPELAGAVVVKRPGGSPLDTVPVAPLPLT